MVVLAEARIEQLLRLEECCKAFIKEQKISCPEAVYQTDRVIVNAYEFIEEVCDIVGYQEDNDEEE